MYNNQKVPTHLQPAADEARRLQDLIMVGKEADKLKKLIEDRNPRDILSALLDWNELTAREVLPLACLAYMKLKAQLGDDVVVPDLDADGLTFYEGSEEVQAHATLPPLYHLTKAVERLGVSEGYWWASSDGDFHFSGKTPGMPAHVTKQSIDLGAMSVTRNLSAGPQREQRLLMEDSEGSVWAVKRGAHVTADTHFNDAKKLPPVPCAILIKVPAETEIYYAPGSAGNSSDADEMRSSPVDQIIPAFRTKFIDDQKQLLEYQLHDGGVIHGRFEWTYP